MYGELGILCTLSAFTSAQILSKQASWLARPDRKFLFPPTALTRFGHSFLLESNSIGCNTNTHYLGSSTHCSRKNGRGLENIIAFGKKNPP